jgi:hypothetical protein
MMRKLLIAFVLFLLTVSSAYAKTEKYCSDNSTLMQIRDVTVNVPQTNRTRTLNVTETVHCDYGCRNNECVQPPWIIYAIVFGLIIIAAVFYILITHKS